MNKDIGIDLGTTYSVVAVKGNVEMAPGYAPGDYRAEYDVTIIPNLDGDPTTPSAVWIDPSLLNKDLSGPALTIDPVDIWQDSDPERRALFLVGAAAKRKAADGEAPIVFSKRSIGTNEPLRMHDRSFTAKEVAVFILKYLKFCAQTALAQPIRRAVVTHPAHFLPNQVQETKEAAVLAGFDMSLAEQMMMEPSAAALSYVHGDPRDPLRVLTYDLGGGTFDVTVLERSEGVITIKAFDGNHLLGGYNFDRELMQWIIAKAQAGGRKIAYDETNPDHRSRRGRLLQFAEATKFKLSEQITSKAPVSISVRDILIDEAGKIVPVSDRINCEQYAALIKPHLDTTIKCCHSALSKAGMTKEDLHLVLLVGGSTCGPWVVEAVKAEFGDDVPPPVDPDLCVAAGAALQADQLPKVDDLGGDLELVHDAPETSGLPTLNLGGRVRTKGGTPLDDEVRGKLQVLLCTPTAGTLGPQPIQANGSFLFPDVELLDGGTSRFELQIAGGPQVCKISFPVTYSPDATARQDILPSLPKPLYVKSARGLLLLAEEGIALPAECEMDLKKLFKDSVISIPIVLADEKIGEIVINQIPPDADEGSPVKLKLTITQKNEMVGSAQIFSRTGAMVKECPVRITFPPIVVPGLPELQQQFRDLKDERDQLLFASEDPEQRLLLAGEGERLVMQLERLFSELEPDKQEIHQALRELRLLVHPPVNDMNPPRAQFRKNLEHCEQLFDEKPGDAQVQSMRKVVKQLEDQGNEAFVTKNQKKWAATNENLQKTLQRLAKTVLPPIVPPPPMPETPTPVQKDRCLQKVSDLRGKLESKRDAVRSLPMYAATIKGRCDELEKAIDKMEADVEKIDDNTPPSKAEGQLALAMRPGPKVESSIPNVQESVF